MINQTSTALLVSEMMRTRDYTKRQLARILNVSYSNVCMKLRGQRNWTDEDLDKLQELGLDVRNPRMSAPDLQEQAYEIQLARTIAFLANYLSLSVSANPAYGEKHRTSIQQVASALQTLPGYLK